MVLKIKLHSLATFCIIKVGDFVDSVSRCLTIFNRNRIYKRIINLIIQSILGKKIL